MKKILLLCDGDHFPSGALRFIRQMRDTEPLYVKGMFFTQADTLETIPVGFIPVSGPYRKLKELELSGVHQSKKEFAEAFENAGIKYDIHPYEGVWDVDLFKTESRFADLVIISTELFCQTVSESRPNYFMTETLRLSESPIVVVPAKFK